MARAARPSGPTPVEAIRHVEDARTNIPTAEGSEVYFDEKSSALPPLRYPRNPDLDPQLVWRGKDAEDGEDLVVDAPPIYIQEKIDPRVLIENLRETAKAGEPEPELTLFDDFDGLDGLDAIEYYRHDARWTNRMILGDSLQVMGSLAEREALRGKVQMIYIDPPYGIKFGSNWQVRTSRRDVKDGKREDSAREAEQIKAFRDTWKDGIHTYLSYLRDRLVVARELLTESGSVFVQIGDENVHLVRSLLDEVFGAENFVSQISYRTTTGATSEFLAGTVDYILWFGRNRDATKYRSLYVERSVVDDANYRLIEIDGVVRALTRNELAEKDKLYGTGARLLRQNPLTSQSGGDTTRFEVEFGGHRFTPAKGGWKTNADGMKRLLLANRLMSSGKTLGFKRYFEDFPYEAFSNAWDDTRQSGFGEAKVYVVQTAPRVIERCMLMCTDPGDLVLDPTCGSGTTAYVAEQWGRRWITIDTSRVALALARQRLMGGRFPYYVLADSDEGRKLEGLPPATTKGDIHKGFVYERVQHITLKSIANNPDIHEGMSREEIDAAIKRHAEYELLYDKPKVDKNVVRVSGPFTMESLSPHRSLTFDEADPSRESIGERHAAEDPEAVTFEQSILENLAKSGIQNGSKSGRFTFASLDPHAGRLIQATGERLAVDDDDSAEASVDAPTTRVAIAIGPQYGTVSSGFVKEALKEANALDPAVDVLYVLGFAFDPNVEGERQLGRIRVEAVRMNVDLLMIDALKKTGAGNLFTVFGEPDIEVRELPDGKLEVELRGVDVFNPNTGEVRSSAPTQIALWMVDTRYDEESFFVRHAYFTGENDPYKNLKTALKADIDPDAWSALYRTISMPFDRPDTGKIAVKVINDYGDEVMKVFSV
ncbi:site-specific DNA-methyltransferase [Gryllotalpicola ginsengisoli]|uniref:site-specific DNA-methyltransferase n=1 Tax=Gryllotalpicola ginsengisoli TaxID=444608 RepID=UPI0003B74027|nr:site-specific DNA-methyltransferase [Gryllotalpicola ginsengisoli]